MRATVSFCRTAVREPLGDGPEHHIAELVAVGVVDFLEPVDVHEEDRKGRAVPFGTAQELVQAVRHQETVGQVSECVVRGEVLQGHLGLPHLVDLAGDADQTDDPAGLVTERELGGERPVRLAVVQLAALDQTDDGPARLHDPLVVESGP